MASSLTGSLSRSQVFNDALGRSCRSDRRTERGTKKLSLRRSWRHVDRVAQVENSLHDALARQDEAAAAAMLSDLGTREVSTLIGRTSSQRAAELFRLLLPEHALTVFESLTPVLQGDLIVALESHDFSMLFAELHPDDRVRLLDELPASAAQRLLDGLSHEARDVITSILRYPAESVGRWMSLEVVDTHPQNTVAETLKHVRAVSHTAETIYVIPVTDDSQRLLGVVNLRDLIENDPEVTIAEILVPAESVRADVEAEIAARLCTDLILLAMPVVDDESRVVGIFTLDDALRTLSDAETEDMAFAGGAEPLRRPYLRSPLLRVARSRVVWLLILAVSALLTVQVLGFFEATLEEKVVLALFIPLLTGTGGNTGSQAATTVTRALAVGDVRSDDIWRVMLKEVRVGAILGLLLGLLGFAIASLVFGLPMGIVMGLTLLLICTIAATVGGAMPMLAKTVRADPAVFSTPFITTFCDATGLIIYFTIAKLVLGI